VHEVVYQRSKADQFIHHYAYDADNRILEVQTSKDGLLFDVDARYFYYDHGPLARTELGDNQVQGVDYAYNLQGWIKGINSGALLPENDMGHDSEISAGNPDNPNKFFAKDVASFSLHYFEGDYQKISTSAADFLPQSTGSYLMTQREDLWNGNIGCMMTNLADPDPADNPQGDKWGMLGMAYRYDQLNRIVSADGFTDYTTSTNIWGTAAESSIYHNAFTYDGNGNILTQKRSDQNNVEFENLIYQYKKTEVGEKMLQNRLYHVNETAAVAASAYADDIDDQGVFSDQNINSTNNYGYTELGELERDSSEHIESIEWRVDSKISYIRRSDNSGESELKFDYDAMGNRIAKHIYNSNGVYEKSTFYVRDASGNVMANYEFILGESLSGSSLKITERPMYGSSRLGMDVTTVEFIGLMDFEYSDETNRELGHKQYELSNHLGNVLSVVADLKLPEVDGGTIIAYSAAVISVTDYSPFGVALYGRKWQSKAYHYGFNGKEKDDEGMGGGNQTYNYGFRIYNPSLGKFLSVDPLFMGFSWNSVYTYAENDVVRCIDLDGLEKFVVINEWEKGLNSTQVIAISFDGEIIDQKLKNTVNGEKLNTKDVLVIKISKSGKVTYLSKDKLSKREKKIYDEKKVCSDRNDEMIGLYFKSDDGKVKIQSEEALTYDRMCRGIEKYDKGMSLSLKSFDDLLPKISEMEGDFGNELRLVERKELKVTRIAVLFNNEADMAKYRSSIEVTLTKKFGAIKIEFNIRPADQPEGEKGACKISLVTVPIE
jgi:RHS repeat-associated protein